MIIQTTFLQKSGIVVTISTCTCYAVTSVSTHFSWSEEWFPVVDWFCIALMVSILSVLLVADRIEFEIVNLKYLCILLATVIVVLLSSWVLTMILPMTRLN